MIRLSNHIKITSKSHSKYSYIESAVRISQFLKTGTLLFSKQLSTTHFSDLLHMIQEISRSLYLLCQLQNTRTSLFVERACRSYFIRRTSRPKEAFTNYTVKLHSFQTLVGYSKLSMCSSVKYVSNVYFDWTWTKAIYFNSYQPSVNMYWSQLVIVSLSMHAYDISIDFYYPLDPREAIELSIVLVRWIDVFVGCGKKNELRVVHVMKWQPISHGYMRQCFSF